MNSKTTTRRGKRTPPAPCSFSYLEREFCKLVHAKRREIMATKGHLISALNPRLTDREDYQRREETRADLMRWAREWFLQRGHDVVCVPNPYNADGFATEEANNKDQVHEPA